MSVTKLTIRAPVEIVFDTVYKFDLQSIWTVRAIFWLRAKLLGAKVQTRGARQFIAEMLHLGWRGLAEEPNHSFIAGRLVSLGKPMWSSHQFLLGSSRHSMSLVE
jgi:hypothetical protein